MRKTPLILLVLLACTTAMAADFAGTWKFNPGKSKINNPDVDSVIMTIEKVGTNAYRSTFDVTMKSGKKTHSYRERTYDGQEHPVKSDPPAPGESEVCTIAQDGSRTVITKKGGKVTGQLKSTVSADGKTLTNEVSGPSGSEVRVFERQ